MNNMIDCIFCFHPHDYDTECLAEVQTVVPIRGSAQYHEAFVWSLCHCTVAKSKDDAIRDQAFQKIQDLFNSPAGTTDEHPAGGTS